MKLPSSTIAAQLRREAAQERREALREHRLEIGTPAPRKPVSIDQHARLRSALIHAERLATSALTAIRGRTASEVAAEAASRALRSLRSKRKPEGQARP